MPEAFVLAPGEGERVSDAVVIKADSEELCVTESLYPEGKSGPDVHIHREHSDSFYVIEGELVFGVAGERIAVGAGGFVLVPPEVVHTFRNEGPGEARFLNFHAPSKGFGAFMRGEAETFDSFDPPEGGGPPAGEAIVLGPGEGHVLGAGPTTAALKAQVDDAIGSLAVTETELPPGFGGPPLHTHEGFVDNFYVLEGTLTITAGERKIEAPAGSFASAPVGAAHTFSNPSDAPVRALNMMAPAGFEQYLKELDARVASDPAGITPEVIRELASRHDFRPV